MLSAKHYLLQVEVNLAENDVQASLGQLSCTERKQCGNLPIILACASNNNLAGNMILVNTDRLLRADNNWRTLNQFRNLCLEAINRVHVSISLVDDVIIPHKTVNTILFKNYFEIKIVD